MAVEKPRHFSEQELSEGKLVDLEPLTAVEDPAVRLAGYNQIPDFGDDKEGTLQQSDDEPTKA